MTDRTRPDADALWDFSTAFYDRPRVADALLTLQDRDARDINLILFALWLGISGRPRLTPAALAAAATEIHPLRTELIEPLRALRRRLKLSADTDLVRLRNDVKRLELAAEEAIQRRLAGFAGSAGEADPVARRATARANLALYLGGEMAETEIFDAALDAFLHDS
jgi:uncharacterized protein (TIGR02444 family)